MHKMCLTNQTCELKRIQVVPSRLAIFSCSLFHQSHWVNKADRSIDLFLGLVTLPIHVQPSSSWCGVGTWFHLPHECMSPNLSIHNSRSLRRGALMEISKPRQISVWKSWAVSRIRFLALFGIRLLSDEFSWCHCSFALAATLHTDNHKKIIELHDRRIRKTWETEQWEQTKLLRKVNKKRRTKHSGAKTPS